MITIIVGLPCTGKTSIGVELSNIGWVHLEASTFIREAIKISGTADVEDLISKAGTHIAAKNILDCIERSYDSENVVVTGFRNRQEIEYLVANQCRPTHVVCLYANFKILYRRMKERKRDGEDILYNQFIRRVQNDYELGLADAISQCVNTYISTERYSISEIVLELVNVHRGSNKKSKWNLNFESIVGMVPTPSDMTLIKKERVAIADCPRI